MKTFLRDKGVFSCGLVKLEAGRVASPPLGLRLGHDALGAPCALDDGGQPNEDVLLSLSDEGSLRLLAWALRPRGCVVIGLGIDLCERAYFEKRLDEEKLLSGLFTSGELELARTLCPEGLPQGLARAFSAKEAGFKSCSRAVRLMGDAGHPPARLEVRDFELSREEGLRVGAHARNSAQATRALELLGITGFELAYHSLGASELCIAVALGERSL